MRFCRRFQRISRILFFLTCVMASFILWHQIFLLKKSYNIITRNRDLQEIFQVNPISCQPVTNVMFLKTHKTASTTVLNILYRFIENHNLTVALPIENMNIFHYPKPFKAEYVEGFPDIWQKYNVMCNHLKFEFTEVQKVMPNNTVYFSILRNPVSLLESSYIYFRFLPSFNKTRTLDQFLSSPFGYYNPHEDYHMLIKNTMWYDFGYDNNAEDREDYVYSVLEEIEQRFQLILITEYFDESMILLKNTLCWELEDVVYFKLNVRSQDTIQNLTQESKERAKQWCSLDWKLYQHFNRTFWKRIRETIGLEKMKQEVEILQARQKELMQICIQDGKAIDIAQIKDSDLQPPQEGNANILGYNLKLGLNKNIMSVCRRMIMPELSHLNLMHKYQLGR
ncbi:LOW QUALITY PROTEIN: galactose-3-O-sulfotransferase 2-like [Rhinatrema bivittatum]|uniref:LOW QUALITY PROTEIN: galactose-3-O-sulfotransferase 2-like n=1 Tax=Rhinatrema bivittatum TaxID=194408 RepID=UPI00112EC10F|nr:LOW QUALITY PROTEIN: galactose-3-O-sulfotransferase 2-like [Rhinatrema bivittatum]